MSAESLRETVARLEVSAGVLAALGARLEERLSGRPLDARIKPHIDEIAVAAGAATTLESLDRAEAGSLLGRIPTFGLQNVGLLFPASLRLGWVSEDVEMLQAAGEASTGFATTLKHTIVPQLDGLASRLESPDARFLDVGVGVGALAIAMAGLWPNLRIVGIDPWKPALHQARENLRIAALTDRVELRVQRAEELVDSRMFDLAWLPGLFLSDEAIAAATARVHEALRPQGWLILALRKQREDDMLANAVGRLRVALFGGCMHGSQPVETMLASSGFANVQTLPSSDTSLVVMIAAQRIQM